ncbi:hypothetical protein Acsp06_16350 [Actinomycetospora sp. NBRC 106375]|uniref:hypothetical protein n=1 Tax=Actinomycetospora sp. NBRC 106375 TaxID=3032207 RepID=UPI0024A32A66|nr:hypothetical protein [Actinomycetospora sp. NBRC 106375]GLZ45450.1 hypothetical protein Acsp06_16350 [Actinomycetospora sp. NBRC 106375]
MTLLAQPHQAPAAAVARPATAEARTLLRTVTYLVVGGALVLLGVLLAPTSTVTTVVPSVPTTSSPAMGDYDTTGGLVWTLYRQAGGSLTP